MFVCIYTQFLRYLLHTLEILHVQIIQSVNVCYYSPYFLNKNKTKHNDSKITSDVSSHVGDYFFSPTHCNITF